MTRIDNNLLTVPNRIGAAVALALVATGPAQADQVIADDLIVTQSECIGMDCNNGESFGFDTLRLKENNLRIKFDDTSNSGSFPNWDWQLTANDSSNGGQNKFSIDDITSGRTPFTIEGSAPSNSLYVDDGGRVGFGTMTPSVELHVIDGDSPTLRLQQDGSSGFTPQTWDIVGNEANFFVRDVTNGSELPFRIKPGAPDNSLFVANSGKVGITTDSPQSHLHVHESTATGVQFRLTNGHSGPSSADGFAFSLDGASNARLWQYEAAALILGANGTELFRLDGTASEPVWVRGNLRVDGTTSGASHSASGTFLKINVSGTDYYLPLYN